MAAQSNVLHELTAETASGNSGPQQSPPDALGISIRVTAQSGTTPTIDFTVEWSPDGVNFGDAETPDAFTQIGATTPTVSERFTVKAPWYQLAWAVAGGTPSYTFHATARHA